MVFNSLIFIFMFLPLVFLAYTLIPNKMIKTLVLVLCSLLFYSWGQPANVIKLRDDEPSGYYCLDGIFI